MAMRKCVVATRSAGLPDNFVDKSTGLIVGSNASELSAVLSAALVLDEKRDEIAKWAYNAVREEVSLEQYASTIEAFLRSIGGLQ